MPSKIQIGVDKGTYTFIPSQKKVVLNDIDLVQLEQVLLITNVSTGTVIYDFSLSPLGGTIDGNTITLAYDTTSMSSSDRLQIFVSYINEEALLLRRLLKILESNSVVDANQRQRVVVESAVLSSGTVTTVTTVSNLTTFPILQHWEMIDRARIAAATVRNQITFN